MGYARSQLQLGETMQNSRAFSPHNSQIIVTLMTVVEKLSVNVKRHTRHRWSCLLNHTEVLPCAAFVSLVMHNLCVSALKTVKPHQSMFLCCSVWFYFQIYQPAVSVPTFRVLQQICQKHCSSQTIHLLLFFTHYHLRWAEWKATGHGCCRCRFRDSQ